MVRFINKRAIGPFSYVIWEIINNLYNLIEIIEQIVFHYIIYLLIIKIKTY